MTEQHSITIEDPSFFQGVSAGSKIRDEHDPVHDLAGSNAAARSRMFWVYAGACAVDDYGITEPDQFALFIAGATTRAPESDTPAIPEQWPDELTDQQQSDLDDLVHDVASSVASNINNQGPDGQLQYLLANGHTVPSVLQYLGVVQYLAGS